MCGIVFVMSQKPIEARVLSTMRDTLIHRGPDGYGQLIEKTKAGYWIGLAHRRLSIIDLSEHGKQPMESVDSSVVIIFNGEIYNYREIRAELKLLGYSFRTQTDTEVLLLAYKEWGQSFLKKLNGMFAFVIWDRQKQEVLVARDRFGEKPLYYACIPSGGIIFASEIKAILAHPEISFKPCSERINSYVLNLGDAYYNDLTFYEGIKKFPQSVSKIFDASGCEQSANTYWDINLYRDKNTLPLNNDTIAEFKDLLQKSVINRLNADVSVGACLSGGLDSSSICSLIGESGYHLNHDFRCYSVRFDDDPTMSEGYYIDLVVDKFKFKKFFIAPNEQDFLGCVDKIYWHHEEPFLSASIFLEYYLYSKIKLLGTKVILDGQGADEILAGYHHYFREYQLDCIYNGKFLKLLKNTFLLQNRLKNEAKKYVNADRRIKTDVNILSVVLLRGIIGSLNSFSRQVLHSKVINGIKFDMLPLQLHSADRNSMAHSIETRFPFLDYNLVDFCLKLSSDCLISNGWTKYILRNAMDKILPSEIQWRVDKVGFAAPQDEWLRKDMKQWACERLFSSLIRDLPQWNKEKITNLWEKHQAGVTDYSWELWRWISLSQWLEVNG